MNPQQLAPAPSSTARADHAASLSSHGPPAASIGGLCPGNDPLNDPGYLEMTDLEHHGRDSFEALVSSNPPLPLPSLDQAPRPPLYMYHPRDHSILLDHKGDPLSIDRMLSTQPLQSELATRPGPGNKRLLYLKGDAVTRLLNQVFGYNGWTLTILKSDRLVPPGGEVLPSGAQQQSHKYHVAYTSHVRITLLTPGTASSHSVFREDVGFGDATDRNFYQAASHALKSSITDGLKRAARHFGDRLGNSLYDSQHFTFATAPKTQQESLEDWEKRFDQKFGALNGCSSKAVPKTGAHPAAPTTINKENMNAATANRVQSTNQYNKSHPGNLQLNANATGPMQINGIQSNATATMPSEFMGAPTTLQQSTGATNQRPVGLSKPGQPQQPLYNPTPHSHITTNTTASNAVSAKLQPPPVGAMLFAPNSDQLRGLAAQAQETSPPPTYWVRNPTSTSTNGGTVSQPGTNSGATATGQHSGPCASTSVPPPSTNAVPPFAQQPPTGSHSAITTNSSYDIPQRPGTAHRTQATPAAQHHVTPGSVATQKRPATTEVLNDPKKTKPATMNPYGPR